MGVEALGVEALSVGALGVGTAEVPNAYVVDASVNPFDEDQTIDQLRFDLRYGFGTSIADTQSCQSTAIINAYVKLQPTGVPLDLLDQTVSEWQQEAAYDGRAAVPIRPDGSPRDANSMSNILAANLGRDDHLAFVYDPSDNWNQITFDEQGDFEESGYSVAIERRERVVNALEATTSQHFTALVEDDDAYTSYDALDAERPFADKYTVTELLPMRLLPTQ